MPKDTPDTEIYPVASALRDAGYVPLPRLWIKKEDMPTIHRIAEQCEEEVNDIRGQINDRNLKVKKDRQKQAKQVDQAKSDKDAAWELHESQQNAGFDPNQIDWPGMN